MWVSLRILTYSNTQQYNSQLFECQALLIYGIRFWSLLCLQMTQTLMGLFQICYIYSKVSLVTWHTYMRNVNGPDDVIHSGPLARYIKLRVAHAPGMPGTFFPPPQFSDSDMHHGTCVTHVPWCMPGSLTSGFLWIQWREKNIPGIPSACTNRDFAYLVRCP